MNQSPPQEQKTTRNSKTVTQLDLTITIAYTNGIDNAGGYSATFDSEHYDFANSINVDCTLNCTIAKAAKVVETFAFAGIGWTNITYVTYAALTAFGQSTLSLQLDFLTANDVTDITFVIQPSAGGIFLADPQEDNDPPSA